MELGGTRTTAKRKSAKETPTCRVDGCGVSLEHLKTLHKRCRICDMHMKAEIVLLEGALMRFCQQCSRLDALEAFDGQKRSCRDGLLKVGERRRERLSTKFPTTPAEPIRSKRFCEQTRSPFNRPMDSSDIPSNRSLDDGQSEAAMASMPDVAVSPVAQHDNQAPEASLLLKRQSSAPNPENALPRPRRPNLNLHRTQSGGFDDRVRRTLTRRISVTIRADQHGDADGDGAEADGYVCDRDLFQEAASVAVADYFGNQQAKDAALRTLRNPCSTNYKPISAPLHGNTLMHAPVINAPAAGVPGICYALGSNNSEQKRVKSQGATVTSCATGLSRALTLPAPPLAKSQPTSANQRPQKIERSLSGGDFPVLAPDPFGGHPRRMVLSVRPDSGRMAPAERMAPSLISQEFRWHSLQYRNNTPHLGIDTLVAQPEHLPKVTPTRKTEKSVAVRPFVWR